MPNISFLDGWYEEMHCFHVMAVSVEHRCQFAREIEDCDDVMNFFKYFELMYCVLHIRSKLDEICLVLLYLLIALALMVTIFHLVEFCFAPMLKVISIKLRMNEYLAGATLLAFGNSLPDLVANMLPVRATAPLYTITLSNSLAVILISGGTIVYLKPFIMNGHNTVKDLLFLALAGEVLDFIIMRGRQVTKQEAILFSMVYILFVIISIFDLILIRLNIRSLRKEIANLREDKFPSISTRIELNRLQSSLQQLEEDNQIKIRKGISNERRSTRRSDSFSERFIGFATRKVDDDMVDVDAEVTRTILHNSGNPKNLFLFSEFFESILPIDIEQWNGGGFCNRLCIILRAPLVFFCTIFIPVVDYHLDKHGWSKLLNCTQIITCPIIMITLTHAFFVSSYSGWFIKLDFSYSVWTLCGTIPLAIIVFLTARTDMPPPYHACFLILTCFSSLLIIGICAAELELLCAIIGAVFYMSEGFVAATLRSFAAAIADVLVNAALAVQGYEKMAIAAIFGSTLFNIVLGISIPCIFNENAQKQNASYWIYGIYGSTCYIFYNLTIVTFLWWTLTFNFYARRSAAIFSFTLYALFLLYCFLVELETIHEFSPDRIFLPK
ncbi:mitochondrial sodium/calcium exchanger protein-like isoform X2 [Drosophila willistoni]|uniref:mitochondrial sodium/calcium exchanger protein-like isoform X2 n=1 Tax=Drosophila willistoni TaxID=7260 RepID=UPI001F0879E9|nr:mitochondrial sodium/calcium exchanger protein-like isoform X2 [Drosophila willistoni]